MFGRLTTYVAAVMIGLIGLVATGPAPAHAAGYGNQVSTSCNVSVTAVAGKPLKAYVDVKGNASNTITGTVSVKVYRAGSQAKVWGASVHYNGSPVTITGPVLGRGRYRAVANFTADPGVYLDGQCFGRFATKAVAHEHTGNPGTGASGGGLPNTGGPSQWWLVLGFGLVLAGGSAAYASRRHGHHAHSHARHAFR